MSYILHKKIANSKMKLENQKNQKRHWWYIGLRTSLSTPLPNPLSLHSTASQSPLTLSLSDSGCSEEGGSVPLALCEVRCPLLYSFFFFFFFSLSLLISFLYLILEINKLCGLIAL
jgi:hypothetical protein